MRPPSSSEQNGHAATLAAVRVFLLAVLILGLLGTGAELLLVGHTEDLWQWLPLVLIVLSFVVLGWHAADRGAASVRAIQGAMVLLLLSGIAGLLLHYRGKVEFQLESDPSLAGWSLFRAAMESQAPPALAPAVMIPMGLVGLIYTYRHPALRRSRSESKSAMKGA